jgi:hypothetical protein
MVEDFLFRLLVAAALLAISATATPSHAPDAPSLKEVLGRMGAYVDAYGEKASIVVATERYIQDVHITDTQSRHRVLVSDFAIVKVEGIRGWMGFRDVVDVDGIKVENREQRLIDSLMSSSASYDEARRIAFESARYNIGPVLRTFNVPTTTLFFFKSDSLDRFKFSHKKNTEDTTWEIGFRESARPTLIRTPDGQSVPIEGTVWVNAADGTVMRTRIRMADFSPPGKRVSRTVANVEVTYARVAAIDMWLPATMTESYEGADGTSAHHVTGRADYTDYRQFQTTVRIK